MRPSSATTKRKDGTTKNGDNLQFIFGQQNQNKDSKKAIGQKARTNTNSGSVIRKMGGKSAKKTMNNQDYLNSVMSPSMINGQDFMAQTPNNRKNQYIPGQMGINMDGRRTQQDNTKQKNTRSNSKQQTLQIYSQKLNQFSSSHPHTSKHSNAGRGTSHGPLNSQNVGTHNNTLNINMNITNIGL